MLDVYVPTSVADLDHVRDLMRAFIGWHRARHQQDLALIDSYFDAAAFEEELATLPGKYAPPHGQLFLATVEGTPAGCVALRAIDATRCEMKRMFVYPEYHGRGAGRALGEAVLGAGRAAGYRTMLLDTSIRQAEAQALYRRLGFREVAPYYELSEDLRDWLVFMERSLSASEPAPVVA
jgi:putative acetyltransferase